MLLAELCSLLAWKPERRMLLAAAVLAQTVDNIHVAVPLVLHAEEEDPVGWIAKAGETVAAFSMRASSPPNLRLEVRSGQVHLAVLMGRVTVVGRLVTAKVAALAVNHVDEIWFLVDPTCYRSSVYGITEHGPLGTFPTSPKQSHEIQRCLVVILVEKLPSCPVLAEGRSDGNGTTAAEADDPGLILGSYPLGRLVQQAGRAGGARGLVRLGTIAIYCL
mmetsp:Transcript_25402/g.84029  ORF Transcript_25402/g.84029 Transcript_25402/m.84029 type:complete len:219 (+) Transcript_25402:475-1131(+)